MTAQMYLPVTGLVSVRAIDNFLFLQVLAVLVLFLRLVFTRFI